MRSLLPALLLGATVSLACAAEGPNTGGITVVRPWARATPGGATTGVVYLEIEAAAGASDRLVSVETVAAGRAELHTHVMEGDVMKMRPLAAIELKPGGSVTLSPHGDHIMLLDLKGPLKEGDHLPLKLRFETSVSIEVDVPVAGIGATAPANGDNGTHQH